MKSTIISETMIRDHGKLVKLLIDLEKSIIQDKKTMLKAFNNFVWELEKHFFTEEKAIFISYEPKDVTEGYTMVPRLINEHNEIFDRIKIMKKNIKKNKDFDFMGFKGLLKKHKNFEDETVYPLFDQELNESEKKIIVKRINEIQLMDMM
jgi:hemerythrin-like domain-containing protein